MTSQTSATESLAENLAGNEHANKTANELRRNLSLAVNYRQRAKALSAFGCSGLVIG